YCIAITGDPVDTSISMSPLQGHFQSFFQYSLSANRNSLLIAVLRFTFLFIVLLIIISLLIYYTLLCAYFFVNNFSEYFNLSVNFSFVHKVFKIVII